MVHTTPDPVRVRFVDITGNSLGIGGLFLLRFTLGTREFDNHCYSCSDGVSLPQDVAGIIGQDILRSQTIDVLFSEKALRVGEVPVPFENERIGIARVTNSSQGKETRRS